MRKLSTTGPKVFGLGMDGLGMGGLDMAGLSMAVPSMRGLRMDKLGVTQS